MTGVVFNKLTGCLTHLNIVCVPARACDWVNGLLMNVFVRPTLFLNEHSCTLSEFILFNLFFFLRPVVCCYEWVLLHLQTKVCGTTKIKSPTRRPFMLDVTEEGLVPKHHRHFYHSVISKGIHCVLSKFWSEDCNHLIFLINFISLLEPNTSNIDAWLKLFLIILTSLNCFLALYHLCASVLEKKKKGFLPGFPINLRGIHMGTFLISE